MAPSTAPFGRIINRIIIQLKARGESKYGQLDREKRGQGWRYEEMGDTTGGGSRMGLRFN
ncbi:hypothetical protein G8770_20850 [Aestuariicella hydrocarbonica]|uniref:Uncharacterized protein n=1 Tax=Pseudomaricurvus hydrocarbonicus TaxID=1470433 RepID=A0A9E5MPB6_9GAMM|nr:hypothetical protein [Aestuariicella hydrocarbonica]NHO68004.1 hypothetical protein [Aestuariicella hydrocarbonica]